MSKIRERAVQEVKELREAAEKIEKLQEGIKAYLVPDSPNLEAVIIFGREELQTISDALTLYAARTLLTAEQMNTAIKCGSEDGHLESHGEAHILDGCVSLLHELFGVFEEYLEFVGFEPDSDEEVFSTQMTYSHIVNRLFLWHTTHSGGTSTAAKCRALGKDYGDTIKFEVGEEE